MHFKTKLPSCIVAHNNEKRMSKTMFDVFNNNNYRKSKLCIFE